jgi:mannose-6-phosphate isomerase-like protein (cupin superfamily)
VYVLFGLIVWSDVVKAASSGFFKKMKMDKIKFFNELEDSFQRDGLVMVSRDDSRPWGGFFVVNEEQAGEFATHYFNIDANELRISGKLSPKILVVAPGKRLSWQYHHRRAEIWKVLQGNVGVVRSNTDAEGKVKVLEPGELITLKQGERHRLVGLKEWGVLAEIWQHTENDHPSDEDDIVRVQDDFGRGSK